jgi:o-succinylbenzoate---CoA ligase
MFDWLSAASQASPDHPFVITPSSPWSFGEAEERVATLAGALRSRDVGPGSVVAVWAGNDIDSASSIFATWRAGASVLLLNTRLTAAEASAQVTKAGAHHLLGVGAPELGVPTFDPATLAAAPVPGNAPNRDRLALIVFTSGSTGRPKGVRLTFGNLEASAAGSAAHLGHTAADRWLCNLPIFHVGGLSILIRSARETSTVILEPGFDPVRTAALLRAGDATLASLVSVTLARTLDVHVGRYSGVKAALIGGGPVPPDLVERAWEVGIPALPTYGMTETASQVATARLDDRKVVPIPGAEIRAVGGRLQVRGPMLSPGYLGEPDRADGSWFETGDVGTVSDEGVVDVLGRADDVIVTGGENVFPGEVEAAIRSHPGVVEVVVIGMADPVWGAKVVAVYEGEAAPGELERHVRYRLAGFKVPSVWRRVDSLPRLPIGKVDRAALAGIDGR